MKKTTYRVTMYPNAGSICNTLALLAVKSNGLENPTELRKIFSVAEAEILLYPSINVDTTPELIGENTLHLDKKVGDKYETVLIIEQVEIFELAENDNVVLQRQAIDTSDIF
jgi:hypothetical protein